MKLLIGLLLIGMVMTIGVVARGAGKPVVEKHAVWTLPADYTGTLQVARGDVVEVRTKTLPLTRGNLEIDFQASVQGPGVVLAGSALPPGEGRIGRLFLFKAFATGPAALRVELLNADKTVRTTWTYQVKVK